MPKTTNRVFTCKTCGYTKNIHPNTKVLCSRVKSKRKPGVWILHCPACNHYSMADVFAMMLPRVEFCVMRYSEFNRYLSASPAEGA